MASVQDFVTIIIPFADDTALSGLRADDVERELTRLGNPADTVIGKQLDGTGIVHFLSMHVIRAERDDRPPHLLIEATVDGPAFEGVKAIGQALGAVLVPVLQMVTGKTYEAAAVAEVLRCHAHGLTAKPWRWPGQATGLPFCGTPGISLTDIRENKAVVDAARPLIAEARLRQPNSDAQGLLGYVAGNLPQAAQAILNKPQPDLAFIDSPDSPWLDPALTAWGSATFARIARHHWRLIALLLLPALLSRVLFHHAGFMFGLALVGLPLAMIALRLRADERANTPIDVTPDPMAIAAMLARENEPGFVQNHMISITRLRPALVRKLSLPIAFQAIATMITTQLMRPGFLSTIGTIHAARWVVIPGTRQMVFVSNYDGSWESYLEDFITKASEGVSAVWSNAIGFPATRWLFLDGATDGDRMKRFARASMQPTAFWYSAYPGLTCSAIRKHAMIVSGLRNVARTSAVPSDAQGWLDLFGTTPRPATALEYSEIQAIAFAGLRRHQHSRMVALNFGSPQNPDGNACTHVQRWLADLDMRNLITFGDQPTPSLVANIAFSARGLAKLGLADEIKGTEQGFPGVFAHGMADPGRRRALGDPAMLGWSDADVDAVLLLYARASSANDATAAFDAEIARADEFGLTVRAAIKTGLAEFDAKTFARQWNASAGSTPHTGEAIDDGGGDQENTDGLTVEPFGFVDGISQPQVRGFPGRNGAGDPIHAVEPGEFILGYTDNRGFYPPSPLVVRAPHGGGQTGKHELDSAPAQQPTSFPDFAHRPTPVHDFGRNGSYLVIRQLHQDVDGFNRQLTAQAEKLVREHTAANPHPDNLHRTREWIAAKMVGRWRDGSPLVEHPFQPVLDGGQAALAGNGFALGTTDPQGQRCPYGAHIRRAVPRDSFAPGDAQGLMVVNRHRLLRRGRPYLDDEGKPAGTLFMCLNADIERQFEFVQQTWLGSPTFHGLEGERDPFALHRNPDEANPTTDCLSIPGRSGGCVLEGLHRYVTLQGGGYFFLPGRRALAFLSNPASL